MISCNRIRFAGYSSVDFDLITELAFDGDDGNTNTFLSREAIASETYKGILKRVHNYKWNEVLSPTITFIKEGFGDFNLEEQRRILKWLTSKDTASFLTVYHDDSEVISYEILGGFTSIETYKLGNGRVVGFVAKFEGTSPWALSPLRIITQTISGTGSCSINIASDDTQNPVYPCITLQIPTASNITITNVQHDISSQIKNNISNEKIIVDGANKVISSSRPVTRIFGNDFNWIWIPLFEGDNTITIDGNCTATIQYRVPIKCGEY